MRSFYGKNPVPSRKGEELGQKFRRQANLKSHKDTIESLTHLQIEGTVFHGGDSRRKKESANDLYVTKLIRMVCFLARHNLAIKELYKPL